jgi:hypothetical protein
MGEYITNQKMYELGNEGRKDQVSIKGKKGGKNR